MNKLILLVGLALAYKAYEAFKTIDNETEDKKGVDETTGNTKLSSKEIGEKIIEAIQNVNVKKEQQKEEIKNRLSILQKELGILHDLELKNEQLSSLGGIVAAEITYNGLSISEARKVRENELNHLFFQLKNLEKTVNEENPRIRKDELFNIFLGKGGNIKPQVFTLDELMERFKNKNNV